MMDYTKTVDIEFPSIVHNGKLYDLNLSREVDTVTYKKIFVEDFISRCLTFNTFDENICAAELWIIKNNPKYDYLWKKESITL